MQNGTRLAAVDLGSNSFRLEIGEVDHGQIHRAEYFKEAVRLGNGLDSNRNLTQEAMQRGWAALARFGERLADFAPGQVRAVATQTLREARNRDEFLLRARTVLGVGIDVIPGREEARLIYQGVAHTLPHHNGSDRERRLVVDIGGRSTELIIGQRFEALATESYRLGSVAWSMKHFADGHFTPHAFRVAEIAAKAVLDDALSYCGPGQWDVAYGSSGTIGAVGDALAAAGHAPGLVTREGLDWLMDRLLKAGQSDKLRLDGIREDRKAVIGGGLAVLRAVFSLLEIDEMRVAQGALRHGVLYELLERDDAVADMRESTVTRLATRFSVDAAQAQRVRETAAILFKQLTPKATPAAGRVHTAEPALRTLLWAAELHEIGNHIAHSDSHKHGAYILDHVEAPGFSSNELHALSQLVLGHRGKLRKVEAALDDTIFATQLLALRLAVLLCHARRDPQIDSVLLARAREGDCGGFALQVSAGWAERFPQSAHLLREEVLAWQKTSIALALHIS